MSEFRQNLASKEWVIIAPERGKKPLPMEKGGERNEGPSPPVHDPDCPFCPGNHERFPSVERHRVPSGARDWAVRVMDFPPARYGRGPTTWTGSTGNFPAAAATSS
jgi:UDPglucose--hexose-1-phosphate uridylyltransferase